MRSRTDTRAARAIIIHLNDTPEGLRSGLLEALSSSCSPACTGGGISLFLYVTVPPRVGPLIHYEKDKSKKVTFPV